MQRGFMALKKLYPVPPPLAFAALVGANLAIAFGPMLVRLSDTGPIATGFWRLGLAAPILLLIGWRAGFRAEHLRGGTAMLLLFASFAFAADIIAWHVSIFQTKIGNATLLANCASLILAIYGLILARRMPKITQALAVFLAFAGAALLMGQSLEISPRNFRGDLLSLLAGLFYTVYLLAMIRVRATAESWSSLGILSALSALLLWTVAYSMGEKILPDNWAPLIALAISSQIVGQGLMTYALPHFSPLIIGLALLLQPALSAFAGYMLFAEAMTTMDIFGGVMVMTALVLVRLADSGDKV